MLYTRRAHETACETWKSVSARRRDTCLPLNERFVQICTQPPLGMAPLTEITDDMVKAVESALAINEDPAHLPAKAKLLMRFIEEMPHAMHEMLDNPRELIHKEMFNEVLEKVAKDGDLDDVDELDAVRVKLIIAHIGIRAIIAFVEKLPTNAPNYDALFKMSEGLGWNVDATERMVSNVIVNDMEGMMLMYQDGEFELDTSLLDSL